MLANKPITIDPSLFNDLAILIGEVAVAERREDFEAMSLRLRGVIEDDGCIDGDGSGLCETHNYLPIEYWTADIDRTQPLVWGSFDPEETGFPVCPDAQAYDEHIAKQAEGAFA